VIRAWVKSAAAIALSSTGLDEILGRFKNGRTPLIVAYHRVVDDYHRAARSSLPAMLVSTRTLERHLEWLGQHFDFVALDEVSTRPRGALASRPLASITFDDGYRDVYEHAFPLLQRKGIPFTVFMTTDLVGTSGGHVHDRLFSELSRVRSRDVALARMVELLTRVGLPPFEALRLAQLPPVHSTPRLLGRLERSRVLWLAEMLHQEAKNGLPSGEPLQMLTWGMLRRLQASGVTIGSHTRSHVWLTREESGVCESELRGRPVQHFAYPAGCFDHRVVRLVRDAGFDYGYTICLHRDATLPQLTIPRKVFWEGTCMDLRGRFSTSIMSCAAHRVFDRDDCEHDRLMRYRRSTG
jgi:peptidoglycan/xylan/chitin deacetylase (PgdA/CDA1 family)